MGEEIKQRPPLKRLKEIATKLGKDVIIFLGKIKTRENNPQKKESSYEGKTTREKIGTALKPILAYGRYVLTFLNTANTINAQETNILNEMKENSKNQIEVYCEDCELKLDTTFDPFKEEKEKSKPCPKCGSITRQVKLYFGEVIAPMRDDSKLVAYTRKETGGKKVVAKGKFGTELHHDTNTFQKRDQFINVNKDTYYKRIINESIPFYKEVREPLSKHKGHGSAKNKTNNKSKK